jgi:hypothetical protein
MPKPLPSVISEEALGTSEYLRLREETLRRFSRRDDPGRRRQDLGPSPRDEFWTLRRSWTGEEYYGPRSGPSNDWVRHIYNPAEALDD